MLIGVCISCLVVLWPVVRHLLLMHQPQGSESCAAGIGWQALHDVVSYGFVCKRKVLRDLDARIDATCGLAGCTAARHNGRLRYTVGSAGIII